MAQSYFDHNATTPPAPEAVEAVSRALADDFGNPSSVHHFGQRAKAVLDEARSARRRRSSAPSRPRSSSPAAEPRPTIFALRGAAEAREATGRRHLVCTGIEHEAVLNTVKALVKRGWTHDVPAGRRHRHRRPGGARGRGHARDGARVGHARQQRDRHDSADRRARRHRARARRAVHTDAVQSVGKIPVDVKALGVDLLSLSAHKFNGPKGAGALWIRRGTRLVSTMYGRQTRTEPARRHRKRARPSPGWARRRASRAGSSATDAGTAGGAARPPRATGSSSASPARASTARSEPRVPNTTNISFDGVEAESLLIALDLEGFAVSTGSACSSGTLEPSHVLRAMGLPTPTHPELDPLQPGSGKYRRAGRRPARETSGHCRQAQLADVTPVTRRAGALDGPAAVTKSAKPVCRPSAGPGSTACR